MLTIFWRIFLRASSILNAQQPLSQIRAALPESTRVGRVEYDDRRGLYEANLVTELPPGLDDPRTAIGEAILLAERIAHNWLITAAEVFGSGDIQFDGHTTEETRARIGGVAWASLSARNIPTREKGLKFVEGDVVRVSDTFTEAAVRSKEGVIRAIPSRQTGGKFVHGVWIYELENMWMIEEEFLESTGRADEEHLSVQRD